jgi:two-component SAPR family response regulator
MRAIVVDDEKLSLLKMERILNELPQIDYVAGYQSPVQALDHQQEDTADIAFLDVEMPEIDGLALCSRLMEQNAGLEVVFVTAHDKYALAAYQQNAIGYLLKPVQTDEVRAQISRVQKYRQVQAAGPVCEVYCKVFGTFYVRPTKTAADILKFRTEKSEELLAYLISQRGKPVSRDTICDKLWPEMDLKKATRNFHTTAYNIRHTFHAAGIGDVLLRVHDCYRLNPAFVQSDLDVFLAAEQAKSGDIRALEEAIAAYDGLYLANKDYLWLVDYQSHYEQAFERISLELCRRYMQNNAFEKAQVVIGKLLRYNPLSEEGCGMQLLIYRAAGKAEEAQDFLEAFSENFIKEMGVHPSEKLRNV